MPKTSNIGEAKPSQKADSRNLSERRQSSGGNIQARRDSLKREGRKNLVVDKTCDTQSTKSRGLGLGFPALLLSCSVRDLIQVTSPF